MDNQNNITDREMLKNHLLTQENKLRNVKTEIRKLAKVYNKKQLTLSLLEKEVELNNYNIAYYSSVQQLFHKKLHQVRDNIVKAQLASATFDHYKSNSTLLHDKKFISEEKNEVYPKMVDGINDMQQQLNTLNKDISVDNERLSKLRLLFESTS